MSASIMTARQECRRYCTRPLDMWGWGHPGDVRRCEHGHLMVGYEVRGTIPAYWRRLSPVLDPILFQRARRALSPAPSGEAAEPTPEAAR